MKSFLTICCFTLLFISCTNKLYVADRDFENKFLPFLVDNKVNRDEIILKFGEPSWVFENGRIFTYRLTIDRRGDVMPVQILNDKRSADFSYTNPFNMRHYSLVLVFSDKGILEKHSLLLTNP